MDELKERILEGVKNSKFVFEVDGNEVDNHFTEDELREWTKENCLSCNYNVTFEKYSFSLSPSLSAIKAGKNLFANVFRGNQ